VDPSEHLGFRSDKYGDKAAPPPARVVYYANAFEEVHFFAPDVEAAAGNRE
jgi:hypothetical protein